MATEYRQGQAVPNALGTVIMEIDGGFAQPAKNIAQPTHALAADISLPAADTVATVVYAAILDTSHVIGGIYCSLAGSGTIGDDGVNLKIEDGSTTVFSVDVAAKGMNYLPFIPPRAFSAGSAVTVTLADPGANLAGKLNVNHWTTLGSSIGSGYRLDFSQAYNSMYL